jgi:hypothetical protein
MADLAITGLVFPLPGSQNAVGEWRRSGAGLAVACAGAGGQILLGASAPAEQAPTGEALACLLTVVRCVKPSSAAEGCFSASEPAG